MGGTPRNSLAGSNNSNAIPPGAAPLSNSGHRSSRNPEKGVNDRLPSTITSSLTGRGSDGVENYENARRSHRDRDREHGHHRMGDRAQDHRIGGSSRTNKLDNNRSHHNQHKNAGSSEYQNKNGNSSSLHPENDRDRYTHNTKDRHQQQGSHQNSVIDTDMEIPSRDATPTSENEDSNNTILKSHQTSHGKYDRDHHN